MTSIAGEHEREPPSSLPVHAEPGRDRALLGLLAAGLILRLTLAWVPFSCLAQRGPLIDDAFYTFSTVGSLRQAA